MKFTTFKGAAQFDETHVLVGMDAFLSEAIGYGDAPLALGLPLAEFFRREAENCRLSAEGQTEFVAQRMAMAEGSQASIYERPSRDGNRVMVCQTALPTGGTAIVCYGAETGDGEIVNEIFADDEGDKGEWNIRSFLLEQSDNIVRSDFQAMNSFLLHLIDSLPSRVFWKDENLTYLGANRLFLEDAGFDDVQDLVGKSDWDMPWPEEAEQFRADDREVMTSGIAKLNIDEPQTRSDGVKGWLRTNKAPIRDNDGTVIGILGTYEDVTEAKQREVDLARSEAKFRSLFDQTFQYITELSVDGMLLGFNESARKRFRIDPDTVKGRYFPDLPPWPDHPVDRAKIAAAIDKARNGETTRIETHYFAPKRKCFIYLDMAAKPVTGPDGEVSFIILETREITERKEAEQAIQELNDTLEQRVRERTAELNKANRDASKMLEVLKMTQEELVHSEKMASLGELVSGVAHEVNTPIGTGVTAATHLVDIVDQLNAAVSAGRLTKSEFEQFFADTRESTQIILRNLERAATLVRSFKQVAVDQTNEEIRQINCADYCNEVLVSLTPTLKKTALEVALDIPPDLEIETYPGSLAQILTNLLMNSITHAYGPGEPGCITITCEGDGDVIHVLYADDGAGMSEDTVNRIFEPFFTTRRGSGGSGLGMNIVFNLVTRSLKGRIKCLSKLGEGTQFIFTLPSRLEPQD